jgi:PmbA protein
MAELDYKQLAEDLVKKCLKKGADAAELYLENGRNLSIEIRNGEVETVEEAGAHGAGFRVFHEGRMAFASCNDFSEASLDNAIASAVEFAKKTTPDPSNVLPEDKGFTEVAGLFDPEVEQVPMDRKIAMAREVEQLATEDPRITKSAGARFSDGTGEIFLANSNGLSKSYKVSFVGYGVSVVAEKGEQKSSGGESCSRRFFADLKSPGEVAQEAAESAYSMLDPRMVDTQKAAVIFHPDVAYAVLGGILAAVNGERVLQGASFLAQKMDQRIAVELVTIIDDGTLPKGLSSQPFDGEGVPTEKRVIVDKGVLKSFMYNTIVAKRAGVKSTGNASRGGFTSLPGIGAHNFYMAAGETPQEDIIKATERGLLLKGVTGYGINPVNGSFSGGASGFWIEKGKIAFPVKGLTIAGSAFDMFGGIDMVGTDLDLKRGFTTPSFRIKEMQIGGR